MNREPKTSSPRRYLHLTGGFLLAVLAISVVRKWGGSQSPAVVSSTPASAATYPDLNLDDPAPSFEALRYAAETGGDPRTREIAIVWLDQQPLLELPPSIELETWLLEMLKANGNPAWDTEYRLWLFNSAFNVLHFGRDQEAFTRQLQKLALHDDVRTMRLYALQHIGIQRERNNLGGPLAEEIHSMLGDMVGASDSGVAGSAIRLLAEWDGHDAASPQVLDTAAKIAADNTRPVDVRVTALHAADFRGLSLARQLAVDDSQPVILRKAAIACMGTHGGKEDFPDLEKLSGENFRLAQATEPALRKIRDRIANPNPPELIPF